MIIRSGYQLPNSGLPNATAVGKYLGGELKTFAVQVQEILKFL